MIMDRSKVDDESTTFIFWDFYECTREAREWIDRVLLRAILQVHIELDRIEIMVMQMECAMSDTEVWSERDIALIHLYIWIVRIELRYEKWSICRSRRKIESYLSVVSEYLETK
jgi:hypothetical protein